MKPLRSFRGVIEAPFQQIAPHFMNIPVGRLSKDDFLVALLGQPVGGTSNVLVVQNEPNKYIANVGESNASYPIHIEKITERNMIAIHGQWWYRGEYQITSTKEGCVLTYTVFNIAPSVTRWLVPLTVRPKQHEEGLRRGFERVLDVYSERFDCNAYVLS